MSTETTEGTQAPSPPVHEQTKLIEALSHHAPEFHSYSSDPTGYCVAADCGWSDMDAVQRLHQSGDRGFYVSFATHLHSLMFAAMQEAAEATAKRGRQMFLKALALEITTLPIPPEQVRGAQAVSLWLYDKAKGQA